MNYWWVNHSQTSRKEIGGGYIWSPTSNKDGSRNETYLNLQKVEPRDLIFSFADGEVGAIGVAEGPFVTGERPEAFGKSGEQWARHGWTVRVRWTVLAKPIEPQKHLDEIVPHLPQKYSPIRSNGYGNQKFYLTSISEGLAKVVLSIARSDEAQIIDVLEENEQAVADELEEANIKANGILTTEKEQLIKARRGQGVFRVNVEKIEEACRLTGVNDKRFLIASHIKPWRESSAAEKLDGNNGLLLSPHVDKLFDRGWISFSDGGLVLCAGETIQQLMKAWGLQVSAHVGPFNSSQMKYLEYHRTLIFDHRRRSTDLLPTAPGT